MSTTLFDIPVHLVRQYLFCPRIPFFLEVQRKNPKVPLWVGQGSQHHHKQKKLMNMRSLKRFNIENAKVLHNVALRSDTMHIHGIVDMLLVAEDQVYPVEFKLHGNHVLHNQRMQLVAYALLAEETYNKPCKTGFILFEEKGKTHPITIDDKKRQSLQIILKNLRESFTGSLPDSSASIPQCVQCEFLAFCNDRE